MIESSIYVGDLRSHIGSRRDVHLVVPGETFFSTFARIVDDLTCDLTIESVGHGFVIHGTVQTNYSAQCGYGLVEIIEPLTVNVNELFEERRVRDPIKDDDETYRFTGDDIDIEQMLRDSILTSLPLAPVCGHGPENCVVCANQIVPFLTKDFDEVSEHIIGGIDDVVSEPVKDSRWSALDEFPADQ